MEIRIDNVRYQELIKNVSVLTDKLYSDAPALTVASVAIIARRNIDNRLEDIINLGKQYTRGKNGVMQTDTWSQKNELGAWSSTKRRARNGKPWMLSRYSWETANPKRKRNPFIRARFTSTLANLLSEDVHYTNKNSPYFETADGFKQFKAGQTRKGKREIWTTTERELSKAVDGAIARAEKKLLGNVAL